MGIFSSPIKKSKFLLSSLFIGTILLGTSDTADASQPNVEKLSFCGENVDQQRESNRRLAYITTLDGQITALDLTKGEVKWSLPTGSDLISSSIHTLELTNNGKMVRMIPSLNGGLYKFDGDSIEAIQITADDLLRSSFKFTDELVISGGKETSTYGVSAKSGKVLYECSMSGGCTNRTSPETGLRTPVDKNLSEHDTLLDDVLIVRRQTQTVRAVEPRTGNERWNFSVGYHELEVLKSQNCHPVVLEDSAGQALLDLELKVIVPEGLVCAFSKKNPTVMLWQHKFQVPIVSAWRMNTEAELKNIDLFAGTEWLWNQRGSFDTFLGQHDHSDVSPSLYLGMFEKQIYIQESFALQQVFKERHQLAANLIADSSSQLRIPWKPFPANVDNWALIERPQSDLATIEGGEEDIEDLKPTLTINDESSKVTALSVLYASEYINGNGFYLFSEKDFNKTHKSGLCSNQFQQKFYNTDTSSADTMIDFDSGEEDEFEFLDDIPAKVIIMSLWYWWKEILVISLTTAFVMNLFLSNHRKRIVSREVVVVERHIEIPVPMLPKADDDEVFLKNSQSRSSQRSLSESNHTESGFSSRFLNDFDLVQCLGKGGFGVVFEVRNKLDDCCYAIKRIVLPSKQESRDRVMREVKTLANCEHQNIVRYFQAWVETPPPGWQEAQDKEWIEKEYLCTSIDIESPSYEMSPLPGYKVSRKPLHQSTTNDQKLDLWISDLQTNECINFDDQICKTKFRHKSVSGTTTGLSMSDQRNLVTTDEDDDVDEDDSSFIQFRADEISESNDEPDAVSSRRSVASDKRQSMPAIFQPPAVACITNEKLDDSFEIEFKHDVDVSNGDSLHILALRNSTLGASEGGCKFWRDDTIDSTTNNNTSNTSFTDNNLTNNNSNSNFSNKVIPFKKTHRRPMSLDLTSCGKVAALSEQQQQVTQVTNVRMYLYIQMQLCQKQSLKDWLRENDLGMRKTKVLPIFKQIVDAVEYVHLKGLIHRDLKPSNIFFSLDGQIRIGDFGLVTDMADIPQMGGAASPLNNTSKRRTHTQQVGTQLYMSPEQIQGLPYNYKVDIYSLGLILFELLVCFSTEMERATVLKGLRNEKFPQDFQEAFKDEYELLRLMLSQSPKERPTTFGIRARPPLFNGEISSNKEDWHFELPPRRRESRSSNLSQSSSGHSNTNGYEWKQ